MVTATETVLDQVRRVARQRISTNNEFAAAMPGGQIDQFLTNVDTLLNAAAGDQPDDVTLPALQRGVERVAVDNEIEGLDCFDPIGDGVTRTAIIAATIVATVARRGGKLALPELRVDR